MYKIYNDLFTIILYYIHDVKELCLLYPNKKYKIIRSDSTSLDFMSVIKKEYIIYIYE